MADGDVIKMLVQLEATAQQMIQEINRGDAAVAKTSTSIDRNLSKVDQAFDRVGRNAGTLQQAVSGAFSAIGAGNVAAAGSIAGLVALTSSTMDYAKEVKNLSALSNASVEEFQRYAYGAKSVGVEQEKLADIFKDTTDRVGEFLARGSGEMADFFKEIAPKIGITADAFKGLSGPQALQLYYSSLEKAGLSQQQITTYMEQMADEATALLPLLKSNGAAFKEFGDRADSTGAVIKAMDISRLIAAQQSFKDLQNTFKGVSNEIVIGLLPTIESVNEKLISLRDNGAAKKVGETIGFLAENVDILATALGVKLAAAFTRYGLQAVVSGAQATKAVLDNVAATKAAAIVKADDAAASAQAAAARLSEASATLASAKALEANTSARAADLLATREQLAYQTQLAAGTVDAARYSTTLAAVEKEVEVAKRESAKASAALTAATTAEAAARNRDTAATVANTAAQAEAASAKNILARAAGGLVGLLGGPVGMIALAAGVGAAFLTMGGNAKTATTSMDDLKRSIADVRKEFLALAPAQRHAQLTAKIKEQEQVTEEADEAYKGLLGSLKQQLGGTVAGRLATELDEARRNSGDLTDTITSFQKRFGLSDKQVASMRDAAGNVYELDQRTKSLSARVAEYRQQLNATNVETKANTDTNVEGTQAGQKALEALQKQLATLQDKTAVEAANRVITENNIDTQSDLAKQLRATAAEIDNQKASDDAAKKSKTEASSAASKAASEAERQRDALKTLSEESRIAVEKADGLTASYVAGKDSLYELTLQERIQQELLKTGKDKLEEVTAAVKSRMDAEARRDINKATRDLQLETSALLAQSVATLQGTTSLEAYNLERAKTEILAGRNAEALTKETAAYIEAMDQRNQALKISQQLSSVEGIMDRLKPEAKLLRDYTKEVDALTLAMKNNPDAAAEYAESLRLLGLEYEQNKAKATAWGQFTEGAVDRVDDAFADAWKNIDQGFDGFATNLKDGFKQLLAELAHMAITKPIIMQIGASLGVGGLSASQNSKGILGLFDSNSSGGGTDYSSLFQYGKSAYDFLNGTGANLYNAYQSGGLSGVYDYGASSLSSYFTSNAASAAGSTLTTAGANAAMGLGGTATGAAANAATGVTVQGLSSAVSGGADAVAAGLGYGAGSGASATAAGSAASSAGLSAMGAAGYGIGGAIAGYQAAGLKGAATGAGGAVAGAYAGAAIGSVVPIIGTAIGAAIGAMLGGMLGSSVWGGDWVTKDTGLALGVTDGDFDAASFEYQKKKGGLFGKNKKRTRYSALDDATQSALAETYAATEDSVESLYEKLGVQLNDGILDGLNIGRTQISTKDKTNEEIQKELTAWFGTVADSMTSAINDATGAGVDGFNFETLTTFVNNLYSVNDAIRYLNVGLYDTNVAGGRLAESLAATAGGFQALQQSTATYFDQFFTDTEKANATLDTVTRAFKSADAVLPGTREGFRKTVEALDLTTDAGQAMFSTLMALAGQADAYYDILEQRSSSLAQTLAQAQSAMLGSALTNLQRAVQRQQTALSATYNAQAESLNGSLSTSQGVVSSLTTMTNGLASAFKTLLGQSDAAKAMLYQQAQATLVSAAAIARAGGSIAGLAGIEDALSTVTSNDAGRYGNWEDFARDQGRSLVLIDELNSAADGQLDQAQASVKALQDQIALAKKQYDMESTKLQGQLDLAQAQIDGINGIDNRLLTVNEALAEILKAIQTASPDGTGTKNADAIIEAAYRAALGRSADAAGAAYWKQQLGSGAVNSNNLSTAIAAAGAANAAAAPNQVTAAYASLLGRMPTEADMAYWTGQVANGGVHDVAAAIKAAAIANGQIPAFANGGSYLGGLALVGERGPEVIDFNRPGYVYNARETAGMLSGADLSGVMGLLSQILGAVGEGNGHLWYVNARTRAIADNTEVMRDQALKEETV